VFKKEHPTRPSFRLGLQPDHQAFAAPKFNSVIDDKAFRLLDGLGIIGANQRFESDKMLVVSDCICPVLCHPRHWDRNRARPAVGEGFPLLLFRLQDGFTVPPWLTFPEAPL
jgi:hypothetical protein